MKLIAPGLRATVLVALAAAFLVVLVAPATASAQGGAPQCSDGVDNDADGAIDYPADQQCVQNPAGGDPQGLSSDNSEAEAGYQGFGGTPPDGGTPPGDGGGGGGEPCEGAQEEPVTISNVFAKKAGGDWEPFEGQCILQEYDPANAFLALSFTDPNSSSFPQNLKDLYPKGTEISFDATGPTPLFVLGSALDMKVGFGGGTAFSGVSAESMTVQLTVPTVEFSGEFPINCDNTQTMDFAGVVLQFRPEAGGPFDQFAEFMDAYQGASIWGTFQAISLGGVKEDGTFDVSIDGCGEGLFYEAYFPNQGLALGGLTESLAEQLVGQLGPEVADEANLNDLSVDGQNVPDQQFDSEFVSPNDVAPEPIPETFSRRAATAAAKANVAGLAVDYRGGSEGSHDVSAAPNEAKVKAAKKVAKECKKKKGKLKVKSGKLICKKKR